MADWVDLADLVEDLLGRTAASTRKERKGDYAAIVKQITPHSGSHDA